MEHRNNVNFSLFIQLAKSQQPQNEWKKKPGVSEYGPWHVTGKINSCILELVLRWLCCLIFALSTICLSLIKHFPNDYKIYSCHLQVLIPHRVAPVKVSLL